MKKMIILLLLILVSGSAGLIPASQAGGPGAVLPAAVNKYFRQKSGLYFEKQWGKWERSKSGLYMASNLKVHPGGEVYVASSAASGDEKDFAYHRAQRFTEAGKYLGWFGGWKNGMQKPGWISMPNSVSFAPNGWVHLLAALGGDVNTYTPEGVVKGSFSGFGGSGGPTTFPYAVCGDKDGSIYVSIISMMHGFINKFDANGKVLRVITDETMGKGNEFLSGPRGLAGDRFGNLYACDGGKDRVVKFAPDGKILGEIKTAAGMDNPSRRGHTVPSRLAMEGPDEPAISPDGGLYVLATSRIFRFDARGRLVTAFGGKGTGQNQFRNAMSLACAPDGRIYVLDSDSTARIASVKILRPAYYGHKFAKVKLGGRVIGMAAADLRLVTVVVEGKDTAGVGFFAAARPSSNGAFSFMGFPNGATYRLSLRGTNTLVYREAADITGTASGNASNLNFAAVAK